MTVQIIVGDARAKVAKLAEASVQCCVTSPPYFGLRDYGVDGQIGMEKTPDEFVAELVAVFRDVRRVLKDDGVLWVNIGDSYARNPSKGTTGTPNGRNIPGMGYSGGAGVPAGLKEKDLIGIPWMLAFALRADGWYLRGDNVWGKPNGMPESVTDRPTRSHEYVFLLTKSARYYYDHEAVRTAPNAASQTRLGQNIDGQAGSQRANGGAKTNGAMKAVGKQSGHSRRHDGFNDRWDAMDKAGQCAQGANLRSVWWISSAQFREGHFAVMPDLLAEICILAGSKPGDTILDPFGGAGTTGLVADRLGRNAVLIELNPTFSAMANDRINGDQTLFQPSSLTQRETIEHGE